MAVSYPELRRELIAAARQLTEIGILSGMEGNISVRVPEKEHMIISQAGVKSMQLTLENLVVVDFDGNLLEGSGTPSSGVPMHAMAYRLRPEAGAVVHTHSTYATSFAVAGREIPFALEAMEIVGAAAPVTSKYAPLGTAELAREVGAAMTKAWAVLLRNHGVLAMGKDLKHATKVCYALETTAQIVSAANGLGRVTLIQAE